MLTGLTTINVELTDRCNKQCWMCGRRKRERVEGAALYYGDMDFGLVEKIAAELPAFTVVQLHNNGEPLLYPRFGDAVQVFKKRGCIVNIVTNGKLLMQKADEVIGNLDTIAISVFENDTEGDEQYSIIESFLKKKGNESPLCILRMNGDVDSQRYDSLGLYVARRNIHAPEGSWGYKESDPTVPEIGVCLDFMHHPAINRSGDMSICVRFDPSRDGVLGNVFHSTIDELWNSELRMSWLKAHTSGDREKVPLCQKCHFWGVPTGAQYRQVKWRKK